MLNLDELYRAYGELMVKFELLQIEINKIKKEINDELYKTKDG